MLVNTLRLYERCLLALETDDERMQAAAVSVLSFLVVHLKQRRIALPDELVPLARRLPEAVIHS